VFDKIHGAYLTAQQNLLDIPKVHSYVQRDGKLATF
jgi:hypothetical protein